MWSVRCTCHDCYLHVEQLLPSLPVAEVMAYAHEQRWAHDDRAHVVIVQEFKPAESSPMGPSNPFNTPKTGDTNEVHHA